MRPMPPMPSRSVALYSHDAVAQLGLFGSSKGFPEDFSSNTWTLFSVSSIGVVATDAVLNHEDLQRLAMMSQDGYARAIRPVHTPFDGDTLFAISTEAVPVAQEPVTPLRLGTIAADVGARAIMRGVFQAADIAGHQSYGMGRSPARRGLRS